MSLYLCIFDGDDEIEGVEVGMYADFAFFRKSVTELLEGNEPATRFPTLIKHHDSDGEWSVEEVRNLSTELGVIRREFEELPPIEFAASWQKEVAVLLGLKQQSLCDCFIDVDGEPLLSRLGELCEISLARELPILFQ